MKKILSLLGIIAALAFAVTGCNDGGASLNPATGGFAGPGGADNCPKWVSCPREVPFTEISLGPISDPKFSWNSLGQITLSPGIMPNLGYDGTLITANHSGDFVNYIMSIEPVEGPPWWIEHIYADDNFPEIDYSRHTLLVASGNNGGPVIGMTKSLLQLSANRYKLALDIETPAVVHGNVTLTRNWYVALLADKLSEGSNVELHITCTVIGGVHEHKC